MEYIIQNHKVLSVSAALPSDFKRRGCDTQMVVLQYVSITTVIIRRLMGRRFQHGHAVGSCVHLLFRLPEVGGGNSAVGVGVRSGSALDRCPLRFKVSTV